VLLAGVLAPSAAAEPGRCDVIQLETLTPRVGAPPRVVAPGKVLALDVQVVRAGGTQAELPAEGVRVLVGLTGSDWGAYDDVLTDAKGTARARLAVPRGARGAAEADVEVYRVVVDAPCAAVEEHGRVTLPWGRAR
jgi:hypothetical protein